MARIARWVAGLMIVTAMVAIPYSYYRANYAHAKRLRVVSDDRFYRSGQLTASGFREAFQRYGIKTVINLQEEARDPLIAESWQGKSKILESEVCKSMGVKYVPLDGGVLDLPGQDPGSRPLVIEEFLTVLDDPANYPILIHCKAGLHRTGLMTAIYRMDKEKRSKEEAIRELRANGFGTFAASDGNIYIKRFLLDFEPGVRRNKGAK